MKKQLQERELSPEDWGGDTIVVPVSATKGIGIDELLENMAALAEVSELKASPTATPRACRNVYAIAPPIKSASTLLINWSMTLILSLTFAPPRMARYGFAAPFNKGWRCFNSEETRKPAPRWATCFTIPTVDACARWTVPNASST